MPDEVKENSASEKVEETKNETVSETVKPTKKSNKTCLTIVLVVVVLLIGLSVGGYFISKYVFNKAGEGIVEKVIESGTGGKVNIDTKNKDVTIKTNEGTFNAGENVSWPSDMPTDVPKFTSGKITLATNKNTEPKGWEVLISNVESSNVADYQTKLKAAGWTNSSESSFGADLIQMQKDTRDLTLVYDSSSKGVSLTVSYKTTQ
ncbi:MAG: hypothetical protein WCI63_01360 [bacterium]